jgi:hypothetical protein
LPGSKGVASFLARLGTHLREAPRPPLHPLPSLRR